MTNMAGFTAKALKLPVSPPIQYLWSPLPLLMLLDFERRGVREKLAWNVRMVHSKQGLR